ncbi:P-loop containing nucleoside triphosphate hydrolase protein [Piromyces finnis]|uniref:p-loop containing nucleoside triphosphate hydrolase protein n=1 Tax=Piromyces finnis TaxID=1754191 RepID=A0A1Y1V2G2_9FUNG|nr:P-loop containing nucleoside triphosphate hydrolase protein [Piromyces finnis]|eukprot:ORX45786.1 P-loop containing nucleoside triphosphate hydrolase protein [Piromyces finnis]
MKWFNCFNCCCCCCYNSKESNNDIIFLIIGINDSGKTTLLHRLLNDKVDQPTPTWGFTTETIPYKKQHITFYDVGGAASIRDIWKNYYAESYGIIFLVDVSDEKSITESKQVLEEVLSDNRLKSKPILILANKVDKISSFEYIETYNKLNIENLIMEGKTSIDKVLLYPCSCLLIDGERDPRIDSSLEWILDNVKQNKALLTNKIKNDVEVQRREYLEEQAKKKKRVEEYRKQRELQQQQQLQQEQFLNSTNTQQEKNKNRSLRSVKIYPEMCESNI